VFLRDVTTFDVSPTRVIVIETTYLLDPPQGTRVWSFDFGELQLWLCDPSRATGLLQSFLDELLIERRILIPQELREGATSSATMTEVGVMVAAVEKVSASFPFRRGRLVLVANGT
jgi:hypothetical protein